MESDGIVVQVEVVVVVEVVVIGGGGSDKVGEGGEVDRERRVGRLD